jgi:hypothetical protein
LGLLPLQQPSGGYREYGVDAIGMNPDGYASNNDNTLVDYGFGDCGRPAMPLPPPDAYTNGVVTPHAAFLALDFAPEAALENLQNLRGLRRLHRTGFYDAVNVDTGEVAEYYLALDQGMIMAALGNYLRNDRLQHYFTRTASGAGHQTTLAMEQFSAGVNGDGASVSALAWEWRPAAIHTR